jgi:hypothetical protein
LQKTDMNLFTPNPKKSEKSRNLKRNYIVKFKTSKGTLIQGRRRWGGVIY